jgi:hypothetical protein
LLVVRAHVMVCIPPPSIVRDRNAVFLDSKMSAGHLVRAGAQTRISA